MLNIAIISDQSPLALQALQTLQKKYSFCPIDETSLLIALGGDGFMLKTLHNYPHKSIYGMNCGVVGFLMNAFEADGVFERISLAQSVTLHPLKMIAYTSEERHEALAINEVLLLRSSRQTAKLRIFIDHKLRLEELVCDGLLLATPAGSTAYNFSAHGPILPLKCPLLALTPISAFRPRRWRGALLPETANVKIEVLNSEKRPVSAVADDTEIQNIQYVEIFSQKSEKITLLFDAAHPLEERIFAEQFTC